MDSTNSKKISIKFDDDNVILDLDEKEIINNIESSSKNHIVNDNISKDEGEKKSIEENINDAKPKSAEHSKTINNINMPSVYTGEKVK